MYSFYGGKPGNPFVIVASFPDIATMTNSFNSNSYTTVHYDEYVIINTANKNHKDNGKIFRRGYNGPEYIAQIVGPAGPAPHVLFKKPNEVEQHESETGYTTMTSTITSDVMDDSLVPGMDRTKSEDDPEKYHDSITWKCYSVKDANSEESVIQVGFIMPYLVIDFETESISAYDEYGGYTGETTIERTDSGQHPFYNKWKIGIPKGIKGDSVSNVRLAEVEVSTNPLVNVTHIYCDVTKFTEDTDLTAPNQQGHINGETSTIDLGVYNSIIGVDLDSKGTFSILCTDGTQSKTYQNEIKWIKNIVKGYYDTDDEGNERFYNAQGKMTFEFNTDLPQDRITLDLNEISNINLSDDGTLTFTMSSENSQYVFQRRIRWIEEIRLAENGTLQVKYNTSSNGAFTNVTGPQIRWISNLDLSNDGILSVYYNTNAEDPVRINATAIRWIDNIAINNGDLVVTYNDKNRNVATGQETPITQTFEKALNVPTNIFKNDSVNAGTQNYSIDISWSDGNSTSIGRYPNSIENVALDSAGNLLMQFSDPAKQQSTTYQGQSNWTYIGNLGNLKSAIIQNGNYPISNATVKGIFQKVTQDSTTKTHLIFTLNPTQIVPTETTITLNLAQQSNVIKYSLDESFNLDKTKFSGDYSISSEVFGLKFDFTLNDNTVTFNGDTAVANILIPSLTLLITLPENAGDEAAIDWQQRLTDLENCTANVPIVNRTKTIYPISNDNPNDTIPTLTEEKHGGTNIINALNTIKKNLNGEEIALPTPQTYQNAFGNNVNNVFDALGSLKSSISTIESSINGGGGTAVNNLWYKQGSSTNATNGILDLINFLRKTTIQDTTSQQQPFEWKNDVYGGKDIINALSNNTANISKLLQKQYATSYHKIYFSITGKSSGTGATFYTLPNPDENDIDSRGGKSDLETLSTAVKKHGTKIATIKGHYKPLGIVGYDVRGNSSFTIIRNDLYSPVVKKASTLGAWLNDNDGLVTSGAKAYWTEYDANNNESKAEINFYARMIPPYPDVDILVIFYILWEKVID